MPGVEDELPQGWEKSETVSGIPYFVNHDKEVTQWDHPEMLKLIEELSGLDKIKYATYRTAMKLRAIQKKTNLYMIELATICSVLQQKGYKRETYDDSSIAVTELQSLIANIFTWQFKQDKTHEQEANQIGLQTELVLNWLLNAYDSGRTGYLRLISIKIGLVCLCSANFQDKYQYLFSQICDSHKRVDKKRLRIFLKDCLQIPKTVGENTAFGGANVEPAVQNCLQWGDNYMGLKDDVALKDFSDWMVAEPQTIVWLPTLHRLAIAETVKHESKCNICKMYPIVGFRYKCLKCFNFDLCQECFWSGRIAKQHKVGHPTQEYCLASTQKEDIKDFAKVMKNKVSKKKKKPSDPAKRRFIPIPHAGEEGSSEEEFVTDAPPLDKSTAKTHKNIEQYAARLADEENLKQGLPNQEMDDNEHLYHFSSGDDDEHKLIQRFSSRLAGESYEEIPDQFDRHPLSDEQRREVETLVASLEDDNRVLQDEIEKVRRLREQSEETEANLDETVALWEDRERMIAREEVLLEHNKQLEFQINRLRGKLRQVSDSSLQQSQTSFDISPVLGPTSLGPGSLNQPSANTGISNVRLNPQTPASSTPVPPVTDPSALQHLFQNLNASSPGRAVQGAGGTTPVPSITDPHALQYLPMFRNLNTSSPGRVVQEPAATHVPPVTDPSALQYLPMFKSLNSSGPGTTPGGLTPSVTDPSVLLHPSFAVNSFNKPSPFLSDASQAAQAAPSLPMTSPAVMQSVASNTAMISMTSPSANFPSVTSPTALSWIMSGLGSQSGVENRPVMSSSSSMMASGPAMAPQMTSLYAPVVMQVQSNTSFPTFVPDYNTRDKVCSPIIGEKKSLLFPSHEGMRAWPGPPPNEWSADDENELNTLVDRMSTSFPLDVQSDTPVEFCNDLLVAANMVGEAVEDLVGNVSSGSWTQ